MNNKVITLLFAMIFLVSMSPMVSAFEWCDWIPFWNCPDPEPSFTIDKQPEGSANLVKSQGLEQYLFDNVTHIINDTHMVISVDVHISRWNWAVGTIENPNIGRCLQVEDVVREDYPKFDCTDPADRTFLQQKLNNTIGGGLQLRTKGKNHGSFQRDGSIITLTLPLSELDKNDIIKIGEDSFHFQYSNETITAQDDNNKTVSTLTLITEDFNYRNGKPNVEKGIGKDQLIHMFYLTNYTNDSITNLTAINLKTNKTIDRNLKIKILELETYNRTTHDVFCDQSSNGTVGCGSEPNGTVTDQRYVISNISQASIGQNYTFGVYADTRIDDDVDIDFLFLGQSVADSPINWASWNTSIESSMLYAYQLNATTGSVIDTHGGFDLTNNGPVRGVGGVNNLSFSFDGVNDYFSGTGDTDTSIQEFSFSVWYYQNSTPDAINARFYERGNIQTYLSVNTNNALLFRHSTVGDGVTVTGDNVVNNGEWQHIVFVYNGSRTAIWYNGTLEESELASGSLDYGTNTIYFGDSASNTGPINGTMDEIYVWDRALSKTEIEFLYSNGTGSFYDVFEFPVNVSLNLVTPANNSLLADSTVNFDCNCIGSGTNCTEINMFVNGGLVNSTSGNETFHNLTYSSTFADGQHEWFCNATDSDLTNYSSGLATFTVDTSSPVVNITAPIDGFNVSEVGETIDLNWTAEDGNGTLDVCWYELDGYGALFNDSTVNNAANTGTSAFHFANNSFAGASGDLTFEAAFPSNNIILSNSSGANDLNWSASSPTQIDCTVQDYNNPSITLINEPNEVFCVQFNDTTYAIANISSVAAGEVDFDWNYQFLENTENVVTCGLNTTTFNYPADSPENLTVLFFANDTAGNEGNDSVVIFRGTDAPVFTITEPFMLYAALSDGQTINLNYNIESPETPGTCWFNYNGANTTIGSCANTSFAYVSGVNTLTLFINDTFGNEASQQRNWTVLSNVGNQSYNNETFETQTEPFSLIVELDPSIISVTGFLIYDNVRYSATPTVIGNLTNLSRSIDIPVFDVDTNASFNFELNVTTSNGSTISNTSSNVQLVQAIELNACNENITQEYITYTTYDISDFSELNTSFASTWEYFLTTGTGTQTKNFTYSNNNETNSTFEFCFNYPELELDVTSSVQADATGFTPSRNFLTDAILTNVTTNQDMYLLNESDADVTVLEVYDANQFAVPNVVIDVQYYDINTDTFITVTQALTSSEGTDVVYLDWLDSTYKFVLKQNNEVVLQTLPEVLFASPRVFQIGSDFTFDFNKFMDIDYNLIFNEATNVFSLTFVKADGTFTEGCLRVNKKEVGGDTLVCDICETSSSATLTCNIGATGNGTYIATFYATGSLQSIDWILEVVGDDFSQVIFDAIGPEDASFYAFMLGLLVTVIMFVNPIGGIVGIILSIFIGNLLGFVAIDFLVFGGIAVTGLVLVWILRK